MVKGEKWRNQNAIDRRRSILLAMKTAPAAATISTGTEVGPGTQCLVFV